MVDAPILVTGASGQLGNAFGRLIPDAILATRTDLDIEDADAIRSRLEAIRPSMIINCAAWTGVDSAESHEERATAVNGEAVARLADIAQRIGARFVSFSTDYVFAGDGTRPYLEGDPTDPVNAYGRSKLVGERLAIEANPEALIVRTSWLLSGTHGNFVATMLRLGSLGEPFRVVDDQTGSPTVVDDVAPCVVHLLSAGATGIVHVTNAGVATWFELARFAVGRAGLDPSSVSPCSTDEYPTPARRPAYSVLGSERRDSFGVDQLRSWEAAVADVVDEQSTRLGL